MRCQTATPAHHARARHHESVNAPDLLVEPLHAFRHIARSQAAPQLRPEADDEIHSSRRRSWLPYVRNLRRELLTLCRIRDVELQVRVRRRAKSKNSSLGRVHAGIISSACRQSCRRAHLTASSSPPSASGPYCRVLHRHHLLPTPSSGPSRTDTHAPSTQRHADKTHRPPRRMPPLS